MTDEELNSSKLLFAAAWLKQPQDPFKAALEVFGMNTSAALRASAEWISDPVVLQEKARLIEEAEDGELGFLPTKADAARLAWEMANSGAFFEDKLKALKLYADIRGYIAKPEAVKIETNITQNKVMVVKEQASDEEWERKTREQQANLIKEASGNASKTAH